MHEKPLMVPRNVTEAGWVLQSCLARENFLGANISEGVLFNTAFLQVSARGAGEETMGSLAPCDPQLQLWDLHG